MTNQIVDFKVTTVSKLPSTCSHKTELITMVDDPNKATVVSVVVLDNGQKKALLGYPGEHQIKAQLKGSDIVMYHVQHVQSQEQVAQLGNLLDRNTAKTLFPSHFR